MKLCRFQPFGFRADQIDSSEHSEHPEPRVGFIEGETVREIQNGPPPEAVEAGTAWPLRDVKLLPPVTPSKVVCMGRNYTEHAAELGNEVPKEPLIFLKPPSAVIGPDEPIVLTPLSQRVDFEGEIAAVIGRRCYLLGPDEDLRPYILGYTCMNDVTARDLQRADGQWTRAKGFDTFCPLGPVIETELDLAKATVETYVNGARRQSAPASDMIFPIDVIIRWVSRVMTLVPGDVVASGTPSGIGPLHAGDVVEVVVSGVGTLRNPVIAQAS